MTKQAGAAGAQKQELVDAVAEKAGITKGNARAAIKAVQDSILELLEKRGRIQLAKFGIFAMKKTAARMGRNPATGEPIAIPAGYRIGFKVSKSWKDGMMVRKQAREQKAAKAAAGASRTDKPATQAKAKPAARKNWQKR